VGSVPAIVQRRDVSKLGKFARTGAGGVRVPATVSRTGVQAYPGAGPGGSTLLEYRPPEEVFDADSLASLGGVPITRNHPPDGVHPGNIREVQLGHVSDNAPEPRVKVDGSAHEWVRAQLVVSDGATLAEIDAHPNASWEVSGGYSCILDMTPGTSPEGEPYHAIQRKIRWNHVAFERADNWARAGADAKLRLDSQGKTMKKIVIDGVELEYGSAEHFAHVAKAHQVALDAAKARTDAETARADALQAKHDAEKLRADSAVAATAADKIDAAVEARMALFARAARLLPAEYETKGKTDAQVRADAVTRALGAEKVAGKSPAYLDAMFDLLADGAAPTAPAVYHKPAPRADGAPQANINDSDEAFRASLAAKVSK
jgi:uncharacterized protein